MGSVQVYLPVDAAIIEQERQSLSREVEKAEREMAIIEISENNFKPLIENFYRRQ